MSSGGWIRRCTHAAPAPGRRPNGPPRPGDRPPRPPAGRRSPAGPPRGQSAPSRCGAGESSGEVAEQGVARIGSGPGHDELLAGMPMARDSRGRGGTPAGRRIERWIPGGGGAQRVHRRACAARWRTRRESPPSPATGSRPSARPGAWVRESPPSGVELMGLAGGGVECTCKILRHAEITVTHCVCCIISGAHHEPHGQKARAVGRSRAGPPRRDVERPSQRWPGGLGRVYSRCRV